MYNCISAQCEKTCPFFHANNKGTDQPAHLHILISAFVIHFLESMIATVAMCKITVFKLVSVVEQACLSITMSDTAVLLTRAIIAMSINCINSKMLLWQHIIW